MRCWIVACLVLLLAQFWAASQHWEIRSTMQYTPRLFAVGSGFVLFMSSVFFCEHKTRRRLGIIISLLAMGLLLLPVFAYN
jgi:cell division protein FtsW (lipid II flippase)